MAELMGLGEREGELCLGRACVGGEGKRLGEGEAVSELLLFCFSSRAPCETSSGVQRQTRIAMQTVPCVAQT